MYNHIIFINHITLLGFKWIRGDNMSKAEQLYKELCTEEEEIIATRRYLHQNPELSFEETNTSDYIAKQLRAINIDEIGRASCREREEIRDVEGGEQREREE